jgi:hypothetical protein
MLNPVAPSTSSNGTIILPPSKAEFMWMCAGCILPAEVPTTSIINWTAPPCNSLNVATPLTPETDFSPKS